MDLYDCAGRHTKLGVTQCATTFGCARFLYDTLRCTLVGHRIDYRCCDPLARCMEMKNVSKLRVNCSSSGDGKPEYEPSKGDPEIPAPRQPQSREFQAVVAVDFAPVDHPCSFRMSCSVLFVFGVVFFESSL